MVDGFNFLSAWKLAITDTDGRKQWAEYDWWSIANKYKGCKLVK